MVRTREGVKKRKPKVAAADRIDDAASETVALSAPLGGHGGDKPGQWSVGAVLTRAV